jgi:hypothetical protein
MSFDIRDENNEILTSSSIRQLASDLNEQGEAVLSVYTDAETNSPGIYLVPASDLGEVLYPSLNSPFTDYSILMNEGAAGYGLSVIKKFSDGTPDEEVRFSFTNGRSYANKIPLPQLADLTAGSFAEVRLKYTKDPAAPTRRIYVGVEINDS